MPQLYITGVDENGRSKVVESREFTSATGTIEAFRLPDGNTVIAEGRDDVMLLESPTVPGGSVYNLYVWTAGQRTTLHRTTTTDFDVVLQGSVVMELETESVTLGVGDIAVLPGTAHRWISGPEGAIVLYNLVAGTASGADVDRRRGRLM